MDLGAIVIAYLQIWNYVWAIFFGVIISIINLIQFKDFAQIDVINSFYGAPMAVTGLTGEFQFNAYVFMTIMTHFIILVAIQQKPTHR